MKRLPLAKMWPHLPIGLLLLLTGVTNIMTGLGVREFGAAYRNIVQVGPLSQLSQEFSLGMVGKGTQTLLGAGMLATGLGLFWRLRAAWVFSTLLLLAALGLDLASRRPFHDMLAPGLSLAALAAWNARFDRQTLIGAYLMSFAGLIGVLAYGVLGALLLGDRFKPPIRDLTTALYFAVTTLSTAGSDIYPTTAKAKLFVVSLVLGGFGIFTTTLVTTLGPLLSDRLKPVLMRRASRHE